MKEAYFLSYNQNNTYQIYKPDPKRKRSIKNTDRKFTNVIVTQGIELLTEGDLNIHINLYCFSRIQQICTVALRNTIPYKIHRIRT